MRTVFYTCSKCGKRLIGRKSNGTFTFLFGGYKDSPIVNLEIYGHVKMKCIRRTCRKEHPNHWNLFNFFPEGFAITKEEQPIEKVEKSSVNPAN